MDIPHGGYVLVCDGSKGLLFRNQGDMEYPYLQTVGCDEVESLPNREQASDRPGRRSDTTTHKSAMPQEDMHAREEEQFVLALLEHVEETVQEKQIEHLIIVAAPKTLGHVRKHIGKALKPLIKAEVDKDLVHHESRDIEDILKAHGTGVE